MPQADTGRDGASAEFTGAGAYTVRDAARALGVAPSSLYRLLRKGALRPGSPDSPPPFARGGLGPRRPRYRIAHHELARIAAQFQPVGAAASAGGSAGAAAYRYVTRRGETFYLHARRVPLPGDRWETSYAFARVLRSVQAVAAVPAGYVVYESPYSGRPYLRKAAGADPSGTPPAAAAA